MDLGDFVPMLYPMRFSINGREYKYVLPEASLDDVLRLMHREQDKTDDPMKQMRTVVTDFLVSHCPEGMDPDTLRGDLSQVPHSKEGRLDITTLYQAIHQRYPKKVPGAKQAPEHTSTASGSFATSRFFSGPAKALCRMMQFWR